LELTIDDYRFILSIDVQSDDLNVLLVRKMQLSVKDVAKLLNVNEKTIYRWLKQGNLPAYQLGNQYRFNKAELLEWATSKQIGVSTDLFGEPSNTQISTKGLFAALTSGGIYYRIEGDDKNSALKSVVGLMRLPQEVDRDFLLQVLLAREAIASTAVGDGIAIPHVRNPIVLHVTEPIVSLCFLEKPIDFGSLDGKPVTCLFTLVSPTVKAHLYLLSRIAFALRDEGFRKVIEKQGSREEIYAEIARVEAGLKQEQPAVATGEVS
jgi:nitrogen PTS system EIIA component